MAFITTGCRVNQADATRIRDALADLPVIFVDPRTPADVVVVNACTLTADADRVARAAVRRGLRGGAETFLAGCLATRLHASTPAAPFIDGCRTIPGTADREPLVSALRDAVCQAELSAPPSATSEFNFGSIVTERSRPVVKVQDGCDGTCAYCIVPRVRGRATSVPLPDIVTAVAHAAAAGAAEVVLTGIDLASWGRDLGGRTVSDLLTALLNMGTGMRFRLSSLEPHGMDDRLLDIVGNHPDVCPHLHIPIQSGSDRILSAMGRLGTRRDLLDRLQMARERIPGLALGLDVLCGFPGEQDDDFAQTELLVAEAAADMLHVFPFSPRPGTPAARMDGDVLPAVKAARVARLRSFSEQRRNAHAASLVGRIVEVVDIGRRPGGGVRSVAADGTTVIRTDPRGPRPGRFGLTILAADGATAVASPPEIV